jgi:hypothetical protein
VDSVDWWNQTIGMAYGLTGIQAMDYFLGTFFLALLATIVGEFSISIGYRVNRGQLHSLNRRAEEMERLSRLAQDLGDRPAYRACNKEGNDVLGQLFFNKVALSAASLWPIFFALQWMQDHLSQTPLPGTDYEINDVVAFLICYVPARILFGRIKRRLPYFRSVHRMLTSSESKRVQA